MDDIIINESVTIPAGALSFQFSRSSGKGGQHVNKVSTRVELFCDIGMITGDELTKQRIIHRLRHSITDNALLRIVCQESRSQWKNKELAVKQLIRKVAQASIKPKERVATKKTRSSQVKRIESKKLHGKKKQQRKFINDGM